MDKTHRILFVKDEGNLLTQVCMRTGVLLPGSGEDGPIASVRANKESVIALAQLFGVVLIEDTISVKPGFKAYRMEAVRSCAQCAPRSGPSFKVARENVGTEL